MRAPKFSIVTFAAALGLALAMPAAWAHPKKTTTDQTSSLSNDHRPSPMSNIYDQPGGCCWGGSILKFNEPMQLTFNQPIRIPGKVLPAGTYYLVMQDTATGNTVSVLDANQRVVSTLETADASTVNYWPDGALVTVAQGAPGEPDALVSWFFPGFNLGHQFIYPKSERKAIEEEPETTYNIRWGANYLHG